METPEQFIDTIKINAQIVPNGPHLSVFYPYPGTVLYDKCVEENLIDDATGMEQCKERTDTVLKLPDFPRKDILFYFENFRNLIQYELLVNKYTILKKLLPLTVRNQKIISLFMKRFIGFKQMLTKIMHI